MMDELIYMKEYVRSKGSKRPTICQNKIKEERDIWKQLEIVVT